jgi:hypothetical protein
MLVTWKMIVIDHNTPDIEYLSKIGKKQHVFFQHNAALENSWIIDLDNINPGHLMFKI